VEKILLYQSDNETYEWDGKSVTGKITWATYEIGTAYTKEGAYQVVLQDLLDRITELREEQENV